MITLLRRLSTRENTILLLTLTALVCLPFALQKVARDSALSLLLPVTILGVLLAFTLVSLNTKNNWAVFILVGGGPLLLFLRIGQLSDSLLATVRESILVASNVTLTALGFRYSSLDFSTWFSVGNLFASQVSTFSHRLFVWMSGSIQDKPSADPAAQAFIWSLGLWLIAAWASWQVTRKGKALAGLTPATILLGVILNNTAPKSGILWLYLTAFLLILGFTNFAGLLTSWKRLRTDFSDSIWEDSLFATFVLVLVLVVAGYMVSTFSIKEMLDRLRERRTVSTNTSISATAGVSTNTQIQDSLPDSHAILGGPTLSQDIVMLISTGDFPSMPHQLELEVPYYHWRTITYQTYTGSGWLNPAGASEEIRPHQTLISSTPPNYHIVHQVVTFPSGVDGALYWTGALVQSDTPLEVEWRSQPAIDLPSSGFDPLFGADLVGGLISPQSTGPRGKYTIESVLPNVSDADLRAAQGGYPAWVSQRYLTLPDTVPERVRALARDLTANAATPFDRALAIETYLRQIPYNLKVPAPPFNQDAADYFLFDLKKGYCDYYATAMSVLARAAGLPSRLVIGYASGTYDTYNAQYVVRQADAHAWPEIYFTGIGWIEFEPTANQPPSVRIGKSQPIPQQVNFPQSREFWDQIPALFTSRVGFAWTPLAVLLVLYLLWISTEAYRLSRYSPPEVIQRLFRRLRNLARSLRSIPGPDETAREYAIGLNTQLSLLQDQNRLNNWLISPVHDQISSLTRMYTQSLFTPNPLTHADIRNAVQIWYKLRWRLQLINIIQGLRTRFTRL